MSAKMMALACFRTIVGEEEFMGVKETIKRSVDSGWCFPVIDCWQKLLTLSEHG